MGTEKMKRGIFYTATDEEIKRGETTDIYFRRTRTILEKKNLDKDVVAEITCGKLPRDWQWAILCGVEEIANLLEDYPVDVDTLPEGTIFRARDSAGIRSPVMNIRGSYKEFCELETAILGLICQSTGIATSAARIKKILYNKQVLSFGVRRMHPAISPMIDRSSYIGGFDGVSAVLSAKKLGIMPTGTMPHSLIIITGDQVKAWRAFDDVMERNVPRVMLCDTYFDEKIESVMAAESIKRLNAIRLDTPGSRRGNFKEIVQEVRWELNARGFKDVRIFISGGLNEESARTLKDSPVDGFGVGTYVSNSPVVDFAMNIVEIDKKPVAKRGVFGGEKQLYRCPNCFRDLAVLVSEKTPKCSKCNKKMRPLMKPLIRKGRIVAKLPGPREIRKNVLKELEKIEL